MKYMMHIHMYIYMKPTTITEREIPRERDFTKFLIISFNPLSIIIVILRVSSTYINPEFEKK